MLSNKNLSQNESHKKILDSCKNIKRSNTDFKFEKHQSSLIKFLIDPLMNRSLANIHRFHAIVREKIRRT